MRAQVPGASSADRVELAAAGWATLVCALHGVGAGIGSSQHARDCPRVRRRARISRVHEEPDAQPHEHGHGQQADARVPELMGGTFGGGLQPAQSTPTKPPAVRHCSRLADSMVVER
jgi:hypothetical protein